MKNEIMDKYLMLQDVEHIKYFSELTNILFFFFYNGQCQ